MISIFDYFISLFLFIVSSPFIIVIYSIIVLFDKFPIIYKSNRIGYKRENIIVYKFRTMEESDSSGVTLKDDTRVTKIGLILRKFKMDELPQFFNVLKNEISLVGPRPENSKYLDLNRHFFSYLDKVNPGIIDLVTLLFVNESQYLKSEEHYLEEILPLKSKLYNKIYGDYKFIDFILPIVLTPLAILYPQFVQRIVLRYFLYFGYIDSEDKEYFLSFVQL